MDSISSSSYIGISEHQQSIDDDIICNGVGCQSLATDHIQTQGYDGTISLALCKSCCSEWEDDSK
jgi:hypothetical protein